MMQSENSILRLEWNNIYDPETVLQFLKYARVTNFENIKIDPENKQTFVEISFNSRSQDVDHFEIVPGILCYQDRYLKYQINKQIPDLADFPELCHFIEYCDYLKKWIDETKNISVNLEIDMRFHNSEDHIGSIADKLEDLKIFNSIFEDTNKRINVSILVLAAITKKFYNLSAKDDNFKIQYNSNKYLSKISRLNPEKIGDILRNPLETLENYDFEKSDYSNKVLDFDYSNKKFSFLNNSILITPNFDIYRQNLDLKLLSYIIIENL